MKEWFEGKKVLVIGNAKYNSVIHLDGWDVVVRCNNGGEWAYLNKERCDVWVNGLLYSTYHTPPFYPEKILRLNYEGSGKQAKRYPSCWKSNTYHWNVVAFRDMTKELGLSRPSTGMLATYYAIKSFPESVSIVGFDCYQTENIYTKKMPPDGEANVHSFDKEKERFQDFLDKGLLVDWFN